MIAKRKLRTAKGKRQGYAYSPMIWIRDATGRHQIWGGTFRTKAEANAAERKLIQDRDAGADLKPSKVTVAEVCQQYIAEKRNKVKASTLQRSEELLTHVVSLLGPKPVAKLRPSDISNAYNALLHGLSKRTVRHCHWQLHGALELAVRWGQVPVNVAARVSPPEPDAFEGRALSQEELGCLLESISSAPIAPLVLLATDTGAREGELLALRWTAVDLDAGLVHIGRSLRRLKEGFVFTEPKTRSSKRTVEISAFTASVLKAHRQRQLEHRMKVADLWTDLDLVFPTEMGTPQSGSYIARAFRKAVAEAGFKDLRFHDLRHSSVSLLLRSGEPMANVSRRAGHSSIGVTVDTYGHKLEAGGTMAATMGAILEEAVPDRTRWLANG